MSMTCMLAGSPAENVGTGWYLSEWNECDREPCQAWKKVCDSLAFKDFFQGDFWGSWSRSRSQSQPLPWSRSQSRSLSQWYLSRQLVKCPQKSEALSQRWFTSPAACFKLADSSDCLRTSYHDSDRDHDWELWQVYQKAKSNDQKEKTSNTRYTQHFTVTKRDNHVLIRSHSREFIERRVSHLSHAEDALLK